MPVSTKGLSIGGSIIIDEQAGSAVLVQELAHELLHEKGLCPDQTTREIEVGSVDSVVMSYSGFDAGMEINYLVLWDGDSKVLKLCLENFRSAAYQINSFVEREKLDTNTINFSSDH